MIASEKTLNQLLLIYINYKSINLINILVFDYIKHWAQKSMKDMSGQPHLKTQDLNKLVNQKRWESGKRAETDSQNFRLNSFDVKTNQF